MEFKNRGKRTRQNTFSTVLTLTLLTIVGVVGIVESGPHCQDQFEANLRWIAFLCSIGISFLR